MPENNNAMLKVYAHPHPKRHPYTGLCRRYSRLLNPPLTHTHYPRRPGPTGPALPPHRNPAREERVFQRLRGLDPLVGVQREALLQQVDEEVEVLRLRVVHPRRRPRQPRAEVAGRLDQREGLDRGLQKTVSEQILVSWCEWLGCGVKRMQGCGNQPRGRREPRAPCNTSSRHWSRKSMGLTKGRPQACNGGIQSNGWPDPRGFMGTRMPSRPPALHAAGVGSGRVPATAWAAGSRLGRGDSDAGRSMGRRLQPPSPGIKRSRPTKRQNSNEPFAAPKRFRIGQDVRAAEKRDRGPE